MRSLQLSLTICPKYTPKSESTLPTQNRCSLDKKEGCRITGLNVTGEKGLLQLPKWGLRMPLPGERNRKLSTLGAAGPNTLKKRK